MEDLKITIAQLNLVWENTEANLTMLTRKLSAVASGSTHLIVLPEMFSTGFTMNASLAAETMNGKAMQWLKKTAASKKCTITGSLIIKENEHFYNRLIWMHPDGTFEKYDKRHLFRMGEENNTYTAGKNKIIVHLQGWRICPLVCYDLRFPVWSRNTGNYDCLIYVANWPEVRSYAWTHLLIARAIENQAYVVGVNRIGADGNDIAHTGNSALINPKGAVISNSPLNKEYIKTFTISAKELTDFRKVFPVALDADKFSIEDEP